MNYNIIGVRYENNNGVETIFESIIYATTKSELHAKTLVKVLEASDESVLFHFSYVEDKIDEKKLDELADSFNYHDKNDRYYDEEIGKYFGFQEGFKAGYRKRAEE